MKVRYSRRARQDLIEIADYLRPYSRAAASRVGAAIRHSIKLIARYPELGRLQNEGVRKCVEPRFGYLIYYEADLEVGELRIVTVHHPSRVRPFNDVR